MTTLVHINVYSYYSTCLKYVKKHETILLGVKQHVHFVSIHYHLHYKSEIFSGENIGKLVQNRFFRSNKLHETF